MIEHNSRSAVTHNLFDFCSHIRLIAMAGTLRAKVFVVAPSAMVKSEKCIIGEFLTFFAKLTFFGFMYSVAIDFYHFGEHFFFSCYSVLFHDNLPL